MEVGFIGESELVDPPNVSLERDFQLYCDRCGQRFDWKYYKKVKIIDNIHRKFCIITCICV